MWWCLDNICGIYVVGVWATTLIKQPIDSLRRNQERIWSLVVHRNKIIKFGVYKDLDVEIRLVTIFLFQEDFSNSHWVCIPNIRYLHKQKTSPFSFRVTRFLKALGISKTFVGPLLDLIWFDQQYEFLKFIMLHQCQGAMVLPHNCNPTTKYFVSS
jgi:hypothetical protein